MAGKLKLAQQAENVIEDAGKIDLLEHHVLAFVDQRGELEFESVAVDGGIAGREPSARRRAQQTGTASSVAPLSLQITTS